MTVEVRRQSTAARPSATNVQKSIVSNENGRDRRASIVTPADGGLRLMTVDAVEAVEFSVRPVNCRTVNFLYHELLYPNLVNNLNSKLITWILLC